MIAAALLVFGLRIIDITFYTLRLRMVVRGRKQLAWIFGFLQALVYVSAIEIVLTNLGDVYAVLGYATGFATGLIVGMLIEDRLAMGFTHLRIVSRWRALETAEGLRRKGFGVTEVAARGLSGSVSVLHCSVLRKNERKVIRIIQSFDPDAFITSENIRAVKSGFL
jgi:uncharacterized protein YebE (UPF0316 family)